MKKSILFLLLITSALQAQISEFAPVGATWYYGSKRGSVRDEFYYKMVSLKDTAYLGFACKKLEVTRHANNGNVINYSPKYIYQAADTIFEIFDDGFKSMLMNFADTPDSNGHLWYYRSNDVPMYVDTCLGIARTSAKDTIILSGTILKTIKISTSYDAQGYPFCSRMQYSSTNDYIIEKIGLRLTMFPWPENMPFDYITPWIIRCYSDNTFSHQFSTVPCDYTVPYTGVDETAAPAISVYPNPATGSVNITISNLKNAQMAIYDLLGHMVTTQQLIAETSLVDISTLTNGLYLYRITQNGQIAKTGKLVVN